MGEPAHNLDPALEQLHGMLWEYAALPQGWNGYRAVPPNKRALERARRALDQASMAGLLPERVVPDVEGGVGLEWFGCGVLDGGARRRLASTTCDNDGDLVAGIEDRVSGELETWELDEGELALTLQRFRDFLGVA